ncbi:MAG: efflux RND transporter periplasmic adaptor subunit [Gammaproteobacteria bacterium]|nr:efflux RND transporter periplasmic adaptor subunit [Gammaproteobacteria bacterium]
MNINLILMLLVGSLLLNSAMALENHDEHQEGVIKLSKEQMQAAGIKVKSLQAETLRSVINAPGEVKLNRYKTVSITPRITAQIIGYHVVLGQEVKTNQPVLTLSSVEMAEAQGALLVADSEWRRVKKLGRKVVSQSRYTQAKANWELKKAKVKAYGMTEQQLNDLLTSEDFSQADGIFDLVATQNGTVLKENYILGQQVEPGYELMRITDESTLWIIANVSPADARKVSIGNNASINFDGHKLSAKVIQLHHSLDEITRTTGIRLEANNPQELLHPGLFVNTSIETSTDSQVLTLPESAVLRSPDGDWQVLVQQDEPGEFKPVEIKLIRVTDGKAVIEGLAIDTSVVIEGAFFVQSELAKSGFDIHNH